MQLEDFHLLVDSIIEELRKIAMNDPNVVLSCKSGDDFELLVVRVLKDIIDKNKLPIAVNYTPGGHGFPDIVLSAGSIKFGIEVKSSRSKGWKINGNSILGSTKDPDVKEIYIIFGKTTALEFAARKYDDCISNIAVTHSPRFAIDMELAEGQTFFDKSKISYKELTESADPIRLVTDYFKSQGEQAWWLGESSPATLKMLSDVKSNERQVLIGTSLARFPELLSSSQKKYLRFATWLISAQSIIATSLRDNFSASGKVEISVNNKEYRFPRKYEILLNHKDNVIASLNESNFNELNETWGVACLSDNDIWSKIRGWVSVAAVNIPIIDMADSGLKQSEFLLKIFKDEVTLI